MTLGGHYDGHYLSSLQVSAFDHDLRMLQPPVMNVVGDSRELRLVITFES